MVLPQSKRFRWSFVGTVLQCMITAVPGHFKICAFFLSEGGTVVAIPSALNRLIEIDRHPFLVFGKRRVSLLQIAQFTRFVRRTRCDGEQSSEFGCFRSVLLCREHLKRPFCGRREHLDGLNGRAHLVSP